MTQRHFASSHRAQTSRPGAILTSLVAGSAVAVALGGYGKLHQPTGIAVSIAGFSGAQAAKSWLTTAVFLLALVQLASALAMAGKLPGGRAPHWTPALHRWSGRSAVLLAVPVVVHCLYALGFQSDAPRVLIHSLLGCFFFGAFVAKMLLLTRRGVPGWAIPMIGGLVFTSLVGLWLTSSLWFFTTVGVTF
ncbi:MAG TPA: DUF6529 family protein [Pseudonocardiaceae bacterium]|jgi:hypothetical protein|nr:DUF6529 family protein [Pseudonocardiaceae bacterium]